MGDKSYFAVLADRLMDEDEGFYDDGNRDKVVRAAERLEALGVRRKVVEEVLSDIILAVKDEYGD